MTAQDSTLPARPGGEEPRNLLCTILFMDLVGYSSRSLDDQARIKQRLNALVARVLHDIPPDTRLALDTGDGAALCFLGDPQQALQAAMLLRDLLAQRYGARMPARIGLHMGPVRVVQDINDRVNVVGDGINVAQRIMDFAAPGQIVVSRACFDIMSRIAQDGPGLFRYAGVHEDKHGRIHELHVVRDRGQGVREPEAAYAVPPREAAPPLPSATRSALAQALARHIGPLAPLLVERVLREALPVDQLPQALAVHIEQDALREAFREEAERLLAEGPGTEFKRAADPPRR